MRRSPAHWVLVLSMLAFRQASAQGTDGVRAGVSRAVPAPLAPLASALLPGSGQFLQHRDRSVAYLAVEVIGWWKLVRDANERAQQSGEFKRLARTVARSRTSPDGPDGNWTYYESMRDYLESGNYSKSDASLVPEDDPNTFNGYTWQVALATTVDSAHAKAQYAERAYKPDMLWTWRNAQLQYDLFKRSTERRNDANAAAAMDVTIITLNHLLSMVDAFAAFRLDTRRLVDGRTAVGGALRW